MTFDGESIEAEEAEEVPAVPGALSLWNVLKAVGEQSELPIRVEGDRNPTVRLGNVSFRAGTDLRPVDSADFYDSYLENVFFSDLYVPFTEERGVFSLNPRLDLGLPLKETALALNATPGTYGVITLLNPSTLTGFLPPDYNLESNNLFVAFEVVQHGGGAFIANLPEAPVRFVDAFSADANPGESVLMRLGGEESWFKVIAPERITLEPTP